MQYFAIGLEQILLDQVLHPDKRTSQLKELFKEVEFNLYVLMCELQLAMHLRRVQPREHIMSSVMEHK